MFNPGLPNGLLFSILSTSIWHYELAITDRSPLIGEGLLSHSSR